MGYTLRIGEQITETYEDDENELSEKFYNTAKSEKHDGAPAFGEPTDYTNERWPSYSAWANAMRFLDLYGFMYDKTIGLLKEHPGCTPVTKKHKEILDKAYQNFYKKYPNAKAGYSPKIDESNGIYEDNNWPKENDYAVRLEWLKYWIDWALENCENPVFYNS